MDKDRTKIREIIGGMFLHRDDFGNYPSSVACTNLECYIKEVRIEAIGWAYADACAVLNSGRDPRLQESLDLLERAKKDLV